MSKTTDRVDAVIQSMDKNTQKYYGLYVNGKLTCNTNMRVYMRAGQLRQALLKMCGCRRYNDIAINKEIKNYIDDLLSRKIIEIKEV